MRARGEIATVLSLVSLVVMAIGVALGTQFARVQNGDVRTSAQSVSSIQKTDNASVRVDFLNFAPSSRQNFNYIISGELCFTTNPPMSGRYGLDIVTKGVDASGSASTILIGSSVKKIITAPATTRCDSSNLRKLAFSALVQMPDATKLPAGVSCLDDSGVELRISTQGSGARPWLLPDTLVARIPRSAFSECAGTTNTPLTPGPGTGTLTATPGPGTGTPIPNTPVPATPGPGTGTPLPNACAATGGAQITGRIDIQTGIDLPTGSGSATLTDGYKIKVKACKVKTDGVVDCEDTSGGKIFASYDIQTAEIDKTFSLKGLPTGEKIGLFISDFIYDKDNRTIKNPDGTDVSIYQYANIKADGCNSDSASISRKAQEVALTGGLTRIDDRVCIVTFKTGGATNKCETVQSFSLSVRGTPTSPVSPSVTLSPTSQVTASPALSPTTSPTPTIPPLSDTSCTFISINNLKECANAECTEAKDLTLAADRIAKFGVLNDRQISLNPAPKPAIFQTIGTVHSILYSDAFLKYDREATMSGCEGYVQSVGDQVAVEVSDTKLLAEELEVPASGKVQIFKFPIAEGSTGELQLSIVEANADGTPNLGAVLGTSKSTNGSFDTFFDPKDPTKQKTVILNGSGISAPTTYGKRYVAVLSSASAQSFKVILEKEADATCRFAKGKAFMQTTNKGTTWTRDTSGRHLHHKLNMKGDGIGHTYKEGVDQSALKLVSRDPQYLLSKTACSSKSLAGGDPTACDEDSNTNSTIGKIPMSCNSEVLTEWRMRKCYQDADAGTIGFTSTNAKTGTLSTKDGVVGQTFFAKDDVYITAVTIPGQEKGGVTTIEIRKAHTFLVDVIKDKAMGRGVLRNGQFVFDIPILLEKGNLYFASIVNTGGEYVVEKIGGDPSPEGFAHIILNGAKSDTRHDSEDIAFSFVAIKTAAFLCGAEAATQQAQTIADQYLTQSDVNGDGAVNLVDYDTVITDMQKSTPGLKSDVNNSGVVDGLDLSIVISNLFKEPQVR